MHKVKINDKREVEINWNKDGVSLDGKSYSPDILKLHDGSFSIILDGKSHSCEVVGMNPEEKEIQLMINNRVHTLTVKDKFDLLLEEMGMDSMLSSKVNDVKAPMPGLVLNILVKEGDEVKKGDGLLILEAMKMENVIKSPTDGKVKVVAVGVSAAVDKNDLLIEFE